MQLDKAQALAQKLARLGCEGQFEEAMLLYPETEAWGATVGQLCDRLRCGCTVEKLVREDADESMPVSGLARTRNLLEALCIDATEQQVAGAGTPQERTAFLDRLADIALAVAGANGSPAEAVAKDARLLGAGSRAAADLTAGEVSLFKRYPEVHSVVQAAKELQQEERPLRTKLQDAQAAIAAAEAAFEGLAADEAEVDGEALRAACASLEHSIGAFVSGAAEFQAIYGQDIEPWTATGTAASPLLGLGPLAQQLDARYGSLRQALQACSGLRTSYETLLERRAAAGTEGSFLAQLVARGPASARELRERAAALHEVQAAGLGAGLLSTERL